ncbi:MAG: hypothetical protein IKC82_07240 [Lentisphaeria bacterium]|nr:hypothetical protein [Lentisphaeria bacterium]
MKEIILPVSERTDEWYGFTRHHFKFENIDAWIAEPHAPAGDGRWSWVAVWPEAYVKRVGVTALWIPDSIMCISTRTFCAVMSYAWRSWADSRIIWYPWALRKSVALSG